MTFYHHTPADHLFVYIDADNKENTGNTTIFPGRGIDYILQDDSLYRWTGLPAPNDWQWLALVRTERQPNMSSWVFFIGLSWLSGHFCLFAHQDGFFPAGCLLVQSVHQPNFVDS